MDDNAAFLAWLRETNPSILELETRDGMWVSLERLMFHYTIKLGAIGDRWGYDDRWCVGDLHNAQLAWTEWKFRGFQGEPTRWNRHPSTGRRRPDFTPTSEHVDW